MEYWTSWLILVPVGGKQAKELSRFGTNAWLDSLEKILVPLETIT